MPDEYPTVPPRPVSRPRTGRRLLAAFVLLLLLAGGLGAWLVWRGTIDLAALTGQRQSAASAGLAERAPAHVPPAQSATASPPAPPAAAPSPVAVQASALEARLALLEERLSRLDLRAEAASGNAARAEGLLIAFAARRTIDRGAPLGFLEDQLKLRFADAQPNAVQTIVDGAARPVTLDTLLAQLDALGIRMAGAAGNDSTWDKVKREVSSLFIIRHENAASLGPRDRLQRAKLMLAEGKVNEAIAELRFMPGAEGAEEWMAAARRYESVQRALDLIETTAMLEPRRLQDSSGNRVEQPSPLAEPARDTSL